MGYKVYQILNRPGKIMVKKGDSVIPDTKGRVPVKTIDNKRWMLIQMRWLRPRDPQQ